MSAANLFDDPIPPQELREHLATLRERIIRAKTPQARARLAGEYYRVACSGGIGAADRVPAGPAFDPDAPVQLVPLPADMVPDFSEPPPTSAIVLPPSPKSGPCVWWEVPADTVLGNRWGEVSLSHRRIIIEVNASWFAAASPHEVPDVLKPFGYWGRMFWFDTHVNLKKDDPRDQWPKRRACCRAQQNGDTIVAFVLTRTAEELRSFAKPIEGLDWATRVRLTDLHELGHALDLQTNPHSDRMAGLSGTWYERLLEEAFAEVFSTYMALAEGIDPAVIVADAVAGMKVTNERLAKGDRAGGLNGDGFVYDYAPAVAEAIARRQREGAVGGVQDATFVTAATVADFAAGRLPPAPWAVDEPVEGPASGSTKRRRRKRRKARPATAGTVETTSVPQPPPS